MERDLAGARQRYAERLRATAQVRSDAVVRAFAAVPRERFLGEAPWNVLAAFPTTYRETDDPEELYRDVLVAIDATRLLNNGQPSAHAMWIDRLEVGTGERAVHVGCGTGYYSAILAELVGATGHVTAVEIDLELAGRARANLAEYPQVDVVFADGGEYDPGPAHAIYVNGGATHPRSIWLDRLLPSGRLLLPLVRWPASPADNATAGFGVFVKITHGGSAEIVSPVGLFPCIGAIDSEADRRLARALGSGVDPSLVRSFRRDWHVEQAECWLHGEGFCLSQLEPRAW
jgi:protein-L-isoaspartate(D-aspartate) O-methyltransferase